MRLILCLLSLFALACQDSPRIVVGAKNFTEQLILGEALAQHIEHKLGIPVERRLNLGGALLAHQALISGRIDLYPEYTGTALTAILGLPPAGNSARVFEQVASTYREKFSVEWLPPLGFNNSFAMVIRGDEARTKNLHTLTDASKQREGWALGIGYEFERRPDGLAALNRTYGLKWKSPPKTMDMGLLYRALDERQVTMIAANTTDGLLAKLDVKLLADDQRAFPPYEAAVAVRATALEHHPGLRQALLELSGSISDDVMRNFNYQLEVEHRSLSDVARGLLATRRAVQ